jgi:hypothetical protein
MKKHAIIVQYIFSVFTGVFMLCACSSLSAQSSTENRKLTTEQEVVDRYLKTIGQFDKPDVTYFSKQSNSIGHSDQKIIELIDYRKETTATIISSVINGNNTIVRYLHTIEKSYMFMEDGNVVEFPSIIEIDPTIFEKSLTMRERDSSTLKTLLPNELFEDEEAYVTYYTVLEKIFQTKRSIKNYAYYSVNSGLLIGIKSIIFIVNLDNVSDSGRTVTHYTYYKDYKQVDGVLRPHKIIDNGTLNRTSLIEYNVDTEYFKNVTFKNPEKAIAELPDEF